MSRRRSQDPSSVDPPSGNDTPAPPHPGPAREAPADPLLFVPESVGAVAPAVIATSADSLIIERHLGSGSFASVLLCRKRSSGHRCAVKRIVLSRLSEEERLEAMNEATLLDRLL